jgi:hypothetical protein
VKNELGLRPVAAHFDNTWDSTTAVENIHNVLRALDVDLYTYVVDNKEYDDIYRAFMLAGVADVDAPTDIGLAAVMYKACAHFGVEYMFNGHSFRTEGISPLGWLYMDGKYIQSVHRTFGRVPMKTFPNLWLSSFLYWTSIKRIKHIRPFYYIDYQKEAVKGFLTEKLGWKWYGGHHLENRFTAFYHSHFLPRRYQLDTRVLGYAAHVRSGQMTRDEGLALLREPHFLEPEIVSLVKKRLGFSDEEFERVMTLPRRTYRDFRTYKQTFERLRPLFWALAKLQLVPHTFYLKYTVPDPPPLAQGRASPAPDPARGRAARPAAVAVLNRKDEPLL